VEGARVTISGVFTNFFRKRRSADRTEVKHWATYRREVYLVALEISLYKRNVAGVDKNRLPVLRLKLKCDPTNRF
jgi:hypothetical protein